MDHELQRRARDVFLAACEIPGPGRREFLVHACGDDPALLQEVEGLLAEVDGDGPLDAPAAENLTIADDVFQPGSSVAGRFQVVRLLGRGGMGEVYEAYDATLKERVALKTMRAEWLGETEARRRFLREIRLARAVSHPNVCRIYDHARHEGAEGGVDLVSMKLLEGATLADRLEAARLSLEEAMTTARALAEGIDAAHRDGVLHLDLKPSNVIVVEAEGRAATPVITDFGIARSAGEATATLTGAAHPIGTPQYMAPEQLRGENPTAAADLYAFGAVLYELALGRRAFAARAPAEALAERELRTEAVIGALRKEAGGRWAAAVGRCLAMDPAERPSDAATVIGLLDGSSSPPPRRKLVLALSAVALLSVGAFGAWRSDSIPPVLSWLNFPPAAALPAEIRLAVLPFELPDGNAPTREYADGLASTVIERIGELAHPGSSLAMIPASESLDLGEDDPLQAASMLGANLIARGRLIREGGQLLAELEIWNAESAALAASERLEIAEQDPIGAREMIAASLASVMRLALPAKEKPGKAASEAYLHYLPARGYLVRENDIQSVERAISEFHRALAEDPEYGPAYAGLAQGYWRKYELARDQRSAHLAVQAADNAVSYAPETVEARIAAGNVHFGTGRHEEAVADFHRALELTPDHPDALIGLGRAYERTGEMEAAEATLRKAIDLRPTLWLGYKWLGLFHYNAGRYRQAIEQYQKILELAPNSAHAHLNIGTFYVLNEDYVEARRHWERAAEVEPKATVLGNLANLAFLQGDYPAAVRHGEKALELNDRPHRLWSSLAAAYLKVERFEDAQAAYQNALDKVNHELEVNPEDAAATVMRGHYHASMGDEAQALRWTEKGLALAPNSPEVLVEAAETYAQMGDEGAALKLAEQAVSLGYPLVHLRRSPNLQSLFDERAEQTQLEKVAADQAGGR